MRRLRKLTPCAVWSVTTRCLRSEFRLKPNEERNELVGFWLARAQEQCPGIRIYAVVTNVSHLHIELEDRECELSRFLNIFLGQLARRINLLDGEHGPFYETRFAGIEVADDAAIVDRIVYTITNPVAANLVRSYREWPGLSLWHGNCDSRTFRQFRSGDYRRAVRRAKGRRVDRRAFFEKAELVISQREGIDDAVVEVAIKERERILDEQREGEVLGVRKVLAIDPFGKPKDPKRSVMPLCHATSKNIKTEYRLKWAAFVAAYRAASEAFRGGDLLVAFPEHCFRPPLPFAFTPA